MEYRFTKDEARQFLKTCGTAADEGQYCGPERLVHAVFMQWPDLNKCWWWTADDHAKAQAAIEEES